MDFVVGAKTEWIHRTYLFITAAGNHRAHARISRISTEQLRAHFVRSLIIVRLLKAWEVTVVRTECDDAALPCIPIRSLNVCANCSYTHYCESSKILEGDRGKDRSMPPFNIISRRSTQIVLSSRKNNKKAKMKKRARLDD